MRSVLQATSTNDPNHPVLLNVAGYPITAIQPQWRYYPLHPERCGDARLLLQIYRSIYRKGGFTIAQWVDQIDRVNRYTYGLTPVVCVRRRWDSASLHGYIMPPGRSDGSVARSPRRERMSSWEPVLTSTGRAKRWLSSCRRYQA